MKPNIKLTGLGGGMPVKLMTDITDLARLQIYVGIPEKTSVRKKGTISNAQLAFIHTHGARGSQMRRIMRASMNRGLSYGAAHSLYILRFGSPLWQIPPRPIIEPAIELKENREAILAELKKAATVALSTRQNFDKRKRVLYFLNRAGMTAQNAVRAWFVDPRNNWPPNAPSTIKRKGSSNPLIDKGELRKSITYAVSEE